MRAGVLQYSMSWENKEENKSKITSILKSSDLKGVDWLLFPEMTLTGFSMDLARTTLQDDDLLFFKEIATGYNCNVSFGGVVDSNNRSLVLDRKGKLLSQYSKLHLFGYGDETRHYKPGKGETSFSLDNGARVTQLICYDLRFSYMFWDKAGDTDIFTVIASWPASRRQHWTTLLKARAIENQCFVIGVNRTGRDPKLAYAGDSMVIDPFGNELLACGDKEGVQTVEVNVGEVLKTRESFPFLKDRLR